MGYAARVHLLRERTCRRCSETKPVDLFTSDKGLSTTLCRACNAVVAKQSYADNREDRKAYGKAKRASRKAVDPEAVSADEKYRYWERKKKDPYAYVIARLKRTAKAKGLPFDLTREDIFIPEHCPVLGIKLLPTGFGRGDGCPEVDRLVPERGYVRGNVLVISHRANRIKDNGSAREHEAIAAWMRSRGAK